MNEKRRKGKAITTLLTIVVMLNASLFSAFSIDSSTNADKLTDDNGHVTEHAEEQFASDIQAEKESTEKQETYSADSTKDDSAITESKKDGQQISQRSANATVYDRGITCLYVNPYGESKEDIDTIKWFYDGVDYHLFLPSDTSTNTALIYYDPAPDAADASTKKVYTGNKEIKYGEADATLITEGDKSISCDDITYNLHVHKSANIPATFMSTESRSLDFIHADKDNKETGTIRIREEGSATLNSDLKQIKGRGNATWNLAKKPYNIKFDKKTSVLGMDKAKKWTLLANYLDPTLIRNPYGFELAEEFGLPYTSDYRHVDMYINGDYLGNYIICESVEVGENRVDINDLDKDNEKVNPDTDIENLPQKGTGENGAVQPGKVSGSRKWVDIPNEPENVAGGYLLELDFPNRYDDEASGFVTSYGQCVVVKSPEYASEGEIQYISELFEDATEALYSNDGYNSKGKHFSTYFDMESFARMYILQELAQDWDSDTSSFFLIKPQNSDRMIVSPIWDLDHALANKYYYQNLEKEACYWFANRKNLYREIGGEDSFLAAAYRQEDFRAKVRDEWESLRSDSAITNAIHETSVMSERIISSAVMDAVRWNTYGSRNADSCNSHYAEVLKEIHSYVSRREGFLDKGFSNDSATIILDSNGGAVKDEHYFNKMPIGEKGDTIEIDTSALNYVTAPARTKFDSWNTEPDGSGIKYMPGERIILTEELIRLYAIWAPLPAQVSVDIEWIGTRGNIPGAKKFRARRGSRKIIVSWKKLSKKTRKKYNYTEIQICPNKKFSRSDTVRKTVKKSKTKASIRGLRKNTTYYVRIRNVRGKGNSKTVSGWTKNKRIKL